jgi:hypothetical protein
MTRKLLAACALLALSASASTAADLNTGADYYAPPAAAPGPAGVFGDVHLSATYFGREGDDDVGIDFGGVVVVPFANGWNAALEADVGYLFEAGEWGAVGTGHLFFLASTWAAGAFVEGAVTETNDAVGVGVEAAAYIGNVDVIGTVGYGFTDPDFWQATAATNIYFDPNTALNAGIGGTWVDDADGAFSANVGLEHRFNNSPVSGFADLGWTNIGNEDTIIATAGARVVFGAAGQTLQDYNRANPF